MRRKKKDHYNLRSLSSVVLKLALSSVPKPKDRQPSRPKTVAEAEPSPITSSIYLFLMPNRTEYPALFTMKTHVCVRISFSTVSTVALLCSATHVLDNCNLFNLFFRLSVVAQTVLFWVMANVILLCPIIVAQKLQFLVMTIVILVMTIVLLLRLLLCPVKKFSLYRI